RGSLHHATFVCQGAPRHRLALLSSVLSDALQYGLQHGMKAERIPPTARSIRTAAGPAGATRSGEGQEAGIGLSPRSALGSINRLLANLPGEVKFPRYFSACLVQSLIPRGAPGWQIPPAHLRTSLLGA